MSQAIYAKPQISVVLYKTIARTTLDGIAAVAERYAGKSDAIDLTPFLGDNGSVVTTKSIREPAGGFSLTFADKPQVSASVLGSAIETVYGLVEPMDTVEIRMWGGVGECPVVNSKAALPIKMRGFVTSITRNQSLGGDGQPVRTVTVAGQDYGKIWQMYQVLYLQAYTGSEALLSNYAMWEKFGVAAVNTLPANEFVALMVNKILNPFLAGFMPSNKSMPRELKLDLSVQKGIVNNSYQSEPGSIFDLLKLYGDVGVWNELFIEDREDGVYVVYRPAPFHHLTSPDGSNNRLIAPDATEPPVVTVYDHHIANLTETRSDNNVANFFWVNNERFDLIGDTFRKTQSVSDRDPSMYLENYANCAAKYYGTRPMMVDSQQGEDSIKTLLSGLNAEGQLQRQEAFLSWLTYRRLLLSEANKDNVLLESGSARIKGGLMRPPDKRGHQEHMKAGDYARFVIGQVEHEAYITQVTDEFLPFRSYTTTITFERGTGFAVRAQMGRGRNSPWLAEQATRTRSK